jgi:hypothetical protein
MQVNLDIDDGEITSEKEFIIAQFGSIIKVTNSDFTNIMMSSYRSFIKVYASEFHFGSCTLDNINGDHN